MKKIFNVCSFTSKCGILLEYNGCEYNIWYGILVSYKTLFLLLPYDVAI